MITFKSSHKHENNDDYGVDNNDDNNLSLAKYSPHTLKPQGEGCCPLRGNHQLSIFCWMFSWKNFKFSKAIFVVRVNSIIVMDIKIFTIYLIITGNWRRKTKNQRPETRGRSAKILVVDQPTKVTPIIESLLVN